MFTNEALNLADRDALQKALDQKAHELGRERYLNRAKVARERGDGSQTKAGQVTLPLLVPHVADAITGILEDHKGKPGKTPRYVSILSTLDPAQLAALTVKHAIDAVGKHTKLGKVLLELGRAVEAIKLSEDLLADDAKRWKKRIQKIVKNNDTAKGRARSLKATAKALGNEVEEWDDVLCVHVGEPLLNALLTTGLFCKEDDYEEENLHSYLRLTAEGASLFDEIDATYQHLTPVLMPMVVRPKPWEAFDSGCYLDSKLARSLPLVRTFDKEQIQLVNQAIKDGRLSKLLTAITAISAVEFELNAPVVELVEWVAQQGGLGLKKFPRLQKVDLPTRPENFDELAPRERARVVQAEKRAKRLNRGVEANKIVFKQDVATMKELLKYGGFFLPHNMDFRGRVYPGCPFNHQRADYIKGCFRFKAGKRLGFWGWKWLRAGLANAGDFGKVSKRPWAERVQWADDNEAMILAVAADPQANREWTKADKPFTFYAFCLEYAQAKALGNPEEFVSHLPIALDGSNSGVQHYAAALRAEEGAYVNLTPSEVPADLYALVASKVLEEAREVVNKAKAEGIVLSGAPRDLIAGYAEEVRKWKADKKKGECPAEKLLELCAAMLWIEAELGRGHVKRNVMTFGYSSETFGFKEQLLEDLMEPLEIRRIAGELAAHPFGDDAGDAAAAWLAKRVYRAVTTVLKRTSAGMKFFQACAAELAHEGKPMIWRTPLGFPVVHKYEEWDSKEVELFLYDRTVPVHEKSDKDKIAADGTVLKRFRTMVNTKPTGVIKKSKQKSAVAPNIIHSMDSSHLIMVVLYALEKGVDNFMLIHDSFATHAADCGSMEEDDGGFFWIIRHAFVDLYENFDLFEAVYDATLQALSPAGRERLAVREDGKLPQKGSLNLKAVLESAFCFA